MSWDHPLGVEPGTGRDLLSRLMLAMTWSLGIALTATVMTVFIGVVLGIISGFSGGFVDATVGRFIDLTLSFPVTMMLLALSAPAVLLLRTDVADIPGLGFLEDRDLASGLYVILILALFGWPPMARVIRGQVLSIREREYIEAAKLMGASRMRLYFKEVLPNVWAPILVFFTLLVPAYISAEAAFSFLGVGIKPPTPTLGNILAYSVSYTSADPTFFFLPGVVLAHRRAVQPRRRRRPRRPRSQDPPIRLSIHGPGRWMLLTPDHRRDPPDRRQLNGDDQEAVCRLGGSSACGLAGRVRR